MSKKLVHMEIIGSFVEVVDNPNLSLKGLKGTVVDETKNLFILETKQGFKKVPKHLSKFKIKIDNEKIIFSGDAFLAPPAERIKIKTKEKQWLQKNKA